VKESTAGYPVDLFGCLRGISHGEDLARYSTRGNHNESRSAPTVKSDGLHGDALDCGMGDFDRAATECVVNQMRPKHKTPTGEVQVSTDSAVASLQMVAAPSTKDMLAGTKP
jgi:hypothetical protein